LVVQETKLQKCVGLINFVFVFTGNHEQLRQVLDCCLHVSILGVGFSQLSVGLALPWLVFGLLAKTEELLQVLNCLVEVAKFLFNFSYFLVALAFHLTVSRSLGGS
jgi:hypothetical protein